MRLALQRALAALLVCALVAGCLGTNAPGSTPGAGEATGVTDTPTPTPSQTPPAGAGTTTGPTPGGETGTTPTARPASGGTVAYENLTETERRAFRAALDGPVEFVPQTPYVPNDTFPVEVAGVFEAQDVLVRNGTRYALTLDSGTGTLYASYLIEATPGAPGENETVVAVEDFSPEVREVVRSAVETGSRDVPLGKWDSLPGELAETRYVEYEGETYRLGYAVGDYWADVLTVERVE